MLRGQFAQDDDGKEEEDGGDDGHNGPEEDLKAPRGEQVDARFFSLLNLLFPILKYGLLKIEWLRQHQSSFGNPVERVD